MTSVKVPYFFSTCRFYSFVTSLFLSPLFVQTGHRKVWTCSWTEPIPGLSPVQVQLHQDHELWTASGHLQRNGCHWSVYSQWRERERERYFYINIKSKSKITTILGGYCCLLFILIIILPDRKYLYAVKNSSLIDYCIMFCVILLQDPGCVLTTTTTWPLPFWVSLLSWCLP